MADGRALALQVARAQIEEAESNIEVYELAIGKKKNQMRFKAYATTTMLALEVLVVGMAVVLYFVGSEGWEGFSLFTTFFNIGVGGIRRQVVAVIALEKCQLAKLKGALEQCKRSMTASLKTLEKMTGEHAVEVAQKSLRWQFLNLVAASVPAALAGHAVSWLAAVENGAVTEASVSVKRLRDEADSAHRRRAFDGLADAVDQGKEGIQTAAELRRELGETDEDDDT